MYTRSQAVARIADRTAKHCRGSRARPRPLSGKIICALSIWSGVSNLKSLAQVVLKITYVRACAKNCTGHVT